MHRLSKAGYWMLDYGYSARSELRGLLRHGRSPGAPVDRPEHPEGRRPVVVVPGVYERWHFMLPIARRLERLGHPVYFVPALGRNVLPIDRSARLVAEVLVAHDLRGALLIGHSKGGLIGKYLMLRLDPERRVHRLVAVNTPFSGSVWAERIRLQSVRMFAADDLTVTFLGAESPVNSRITSVYGTFDQNVPAGSVLPGAVNRQVPVAGHSRIIGSRALAAVLEEELGEPGG